MSFVESVSIDTTLVDDVEVTSAVVETTIATTSFAGDPTSSSGGSGSTAVVAGEDRLTVFGASGKFGAAPGSPVTPSGNRQRLVPVPGMNFEPGMGPFFSTILPDGTVALPNIQLTTNQVAATGTTMAMSFWHPDLGHYTVRVPTNAGVYETLSVNSISGVVSDVGGADICDSTLVYDGVTPVLFGLSAFPYKGWRVATYGIYPVCPAFVLNATSGRWEYSEARSVFPNALQSSDPVNGANAWPNITNFYGETVIQPRLPAEFVTLPRSGHVAMSIYAPRAGHLWGSVAVLDLLGKAQKAWLEFPDMVNSFGWGTNAFTRDINADPTSVVNDERFVVNMDVFMQPNETWNATVWADSGTFTLTWGASTSAGMPVGVSAADMRAVLEAMPSIGVGNVVVREQRPFLVATFVTYEIEMVGTLAHTNLTATTAAMGTGGLVNDHGSNINRWRHGGTGYTAQSNFPIIELSYNAGASTITQKTVPMFAQQGTEQPNRGEKPDASCSMTWYTSAGDLVVAIAGHSSNPQMFTAFQPKGIHGWRSKGAGVDRGYVAQATPTVGWESRYGEARPSPDFMTYPMHQDSNALPLGCAEDQATGSIVVPCASGVQLLLQPHGRWTARSGPLVRPVQPASSGDITTAGWIVTGGSGALAYDGVEGSMKWTSSSTSDALVQTPVGVSGIPIPAEWAGEVLLFTVESKAATVKRLIRAAARFWSAGGAEVGSLTGYGPAVSYNSTTGYRRVVNAAVVPAGAAFLSFHWEVLDPAGAGEVHFIRRFEAALAPFWPSPAKTNAGTVPLYTGMAGGSWTAKGFVDPETRMLYVPYLQTMSAALAKNTRHPAWLMRLNMADVFPAHTYSGRAYTAAQWTALNLVLEPGEQGHETDTRKSKVGVAAGTAWVDLGYETT